MCIIIDACVVGDYLNENCDYMNPIRKWIDQGKGKIAYSPIQKFKDKVFNSPRVRSKYTEYARRGKVKLVDLNEVISKENMLIQSGKLISDDSHVIALALIGKVTLLVTNDDDLIEDFTNCLGKGKRKGKVIKKGHAYSQNELNKLMSSDRCP